MYVNPVRYPGGKGQKKVVERVSELLPDGYLDGKTWVEPFCGGCGLGLSLVSRGIIEKAVFNDGDKRISAMWNAMVKQTDRFISDFEAVPITVNQYYNSRAIANDESASDYDIGFHTYLLDRMCVSGYIDGGIIGGKAQEGRYKVDARCNKPNLIKRIVGLRELVDAGKIEFNTTHNDAVSFMSSYGGNADVVVYCDPPYYAMGRQCYACRVDHEALAGFLRAAEFKWLLSYDDCPQIRELYDGCRMEQLDITYMNNAKTRGKTGELLIFAS